MNIKNFSLSTALLTCLLFVWSDSPALAQLEEPQPVLVTNAPAHGTFYLMSAIPAVPYPFDPYHGALPIYAFDGVLFVDDTTVSLLAQEAFFGEGGGMMFLSGGPAPPGVGGTNYGATNLICASLTNFVVSYQSSTNGLALGIAQTTNSFIDLTILTATTNAPYDVFGTTNMNALALPQLGRTNWVWLARASSAVTNFTWGLTNWCERYFQLGTTNDLDGDGLTTAFEFLASHTGTNIWDTDGDGIGDGAEVFFGLNPRVSDPPFTISITQPAAVLWP